MTIRIIKKGDRRAVASVSPPEKAASTVMQVPIRDTRHPLDPLVITLAKKAAWEDHLKALKNKAD